MIKGLVDFFIGAIQFLIVVLIVLGGVLGYYLIPSEWPYYDRWDDLQFFELHGFWKAVIGVVISFIIQALFLGPALVLIDSRDTLRSIESSIRDLNKTLASKES
jgi:uncharacterized protein YacL